MANESIDERVAFLERSMSGKTLGEHFREHAELIDRRFTEIHSRFAAQDKRFDAIDAAFVAVHARFGAMDDRFDRVDHELGSIRRDLALILKKLNA
jgi:hypothetical protein